MPNPERSPFASPTVGAHLLRGALAAAALAAAALAAVATLLPLGGAIGVGGSVTALALAAILLRGCPMCWLLGLFDTISLCRPPPAPSRRDPRIAPVS